MRMRRDELSCIVGGMKKSKLSGEIVNIKPPNTHQSYARTQGKARTRRYLYICVHGNITDKNQTVGATQSH